MTDTCATCAFFLAADDPPTKGLCRQSTPRVFAVPPTPASGSAQTTFETKWPTVMPDEWCGQFKAPAP